MSNSADPPPCRGAFFQSPFDHQINASLVVKRGEPCQIILRTPDIKEITVLRAPKRGTAEPVPEMAAVTYTPSAATGRDRFIYNSTRRQNDGPETKQTITIEIEILSQADYPYNFKAPEFPLPQPPPPAPPPAPPADKKPPAK